MRIDFQEITIKNFFSYGARPTTLQLNEYPFNLITGTNGKGKSSLVVEAIFFALFGKPFKNIKIKSIVNDINKKNCVVDLKFKINNKLDCRIVRGLSPDFVEFYKGDQQEDSRSSKKLMQKEIDEVIKLNADTLKNICILSSNESKSFLDMNAGEARTVVENLFGIYVYSLMLQETKLQKNEVSDKLKVIDKDISLYTEIIEDYKRNFKKIKELKENFEKEKIEKLKKLEDKKIELTKEVFPLQVKIDSKSEIEKKITLFESELKKSESFKAEQMTHVNLYSSLIKEAQETKNILNDNTTCPVCSNDLSAEHREKELKNIDIKIQDYTTKINDSLKLIASKKDIYIAMQSDLNSLKEELKKCSTYLDNYNKINLNLKMIDETIESTSKDTMDKHITAIVDLEKIKAYVEKFKVLKQEQEDLKKEIIYHDVIKDILSDDGVKSYIIKKDLPYLNTKINEYLRKLGFSLNLEFTDTFDLIINNPRKKGYDYHNFSNGQKKRIDLAILLAFIDLAKRKNSINTNLLVFDEVLDSSLDSEGAGDFIDILNKKIKESNLNVFIITHKKDLVFEDCNRIEIEQDGEFSYMKR